MEIKSRTLTKNGTTAVIQLHFHLSFHYHRIIDTFGKVHWWSPFEHLMELEYCPCSLDLWQKVHTVRWSNSHSLKRSCSSIARIQDIGRRCVRSPYSCRESTPSRGYKLWIEDSICLNWGFPVWHKASNNPSELTRRPIRAEHISRVVFNENRLQFYGRSVFLLIRPPAPRQLFAHGTISSVAPTR